MDSASETTSKLSNAAKRRLRSKKPQLPATATATATTTTSSGSSEAKSDGIIAVAAAAGRYDKDTCSVWAHETLDIVKKGEYVASGSGMKVGIAEQIKTARLQTRLYVPRADYGMASSASSSSTILASAPAAPARQETVFEITRESTLEAARRLSNLVSNSAPRGESKIADVPIQLQQRKQQQRCRHTAALSATTKSAPVDPASLTAAAAVETKASRVLTTTVTTTTTSDTTTAKAASGAAGKAISGASLLLLHQSAKKVAVLNFASAKNPGGGFLRGQSTQEEKLAMSSSLYDCQTSAVAAPFYALHNNAQQLRKAETFSCAYTDTLIYSAGVPVFRADDGKLLESPYCVDMITCAAVNASVAMSRGVSREQIQVAMRKRIWHILEAARIEGCTHLVLGQFGCGVFGNDLRDVARIFGELLCAPVPTPNPTGTVGTSTGVTAGGASMAAPFHNVFQHVTFAMFSADPASEAIRIWQAAFRHCIK